MNDKERFFGPEEPRFTLAALDAAVARERERIADSLNAVVAWQVNPLVHPLTCGVDSTHNNLWPILDKMGNVNLLCECGYLQKNVPEVCLKFPVEAR